VPRTATVYRVHSSASCDNNNISTRDCARERLLGASRSPPGCDKILCFYKSCILFFCTRIICYYYVAEHSNACLYIYIYISPSSVCPKIQTVISRCCFISGRPGSLVALLIMLPYAAVTLRLCGISDHVIRTYPWFV